MQNQMMYTGVSSPTYQRTENRTRGKVGVLILSLLVVVLIGASLAWLQWSSQRGIVLGYPIPHIHISTAPNRLTLGQSGQFNADATGRELTYSWDFGDQSQASGQTVSHTFQSNGTHTVTVFVTDRIGHTSSDTYTVQVMPPPPSASFTYYVSYSGSVTFDASASTADSSTSIATYTWDYGDGSSPDTENYSQAYHTYNNTGSYTVKLIVTDAIGQQSDPYTVTVVIS